MDPNFYCFGSAYDSSRLISFYAGLVRSKNAISVLMQCFAIACIVSVAWVVYGYSLAFTEGNAFIGGTSAFFLNGIGRDTLAPEQQCLIPCLSYFK